MRPNNTTTEKKTNTQEPQDDQTDEKIKMITELNNELRSGKPLHITSEYVRMAKKSKKREDQPLIISTPDVSINKNEKSRDSREKRDKSRDSLGSRRTHYSKLSRLSRFSKSSKDRKTEHKSRQRERTRSDEPIVISEVIDHRERRSSRRKKRGRKLKKPIRFSSRESHDSRRSTRSLGSNHSFRSQCAHCARLRRMNNYNEPTQYYGDYNQGYTSNYSQPFYQSYTYGSNSTQSNPAITNAYTNTNENQYFKREQSKFIQTYYDYGQYRKS